MRIAPQPSHTKVTTGMRALNVSDSRQLLPPRTLLNVDYWDEDVHASTDGMRTRAETFESNSVRCAMTRTFKPAHHSASTLSLNDPKRKTL